MLYGPIMIGPHKCTQMCWLAQSKTSDSKCFDAANQQIWVHLWGPCMMGVYYIMIIIKISKQRILIGRIFHFRRCQIILWRNKMEPFDLAWFGCCPIRHIWSDDYWIPTCSSNEVTRSTALGLPKQQVVVNRCKLMRKTERMPAF